MKVTGEIVRRALADTERRRDCIQKFTFGGPLTDHVVRDVSKRGPDSVLHKARVPCGENARAHAEALEFAETVKAQILADRINELMAEG